MLNHRMISSVIASVCGLVVGAHAQEWGLSTQFLFGGTAPRVKAISAVDPDNVWAALSGSSATGAIYHYNGSTWTLQYSALDGIAGEIRGLYAHSPSNVWAVGNRTSGGGIIFHFDGVSWSQQVETADCSILFDVYSADGSNVWAAGNSGVILRSRDGGATWDTDTDTGSDLWQAVHGVDTRHVWAVGGTSPSRILFYDGTTWVEQHSLTIPLAGRYLRDVWATAPDQVWAAGDGGIILHYDGNGWSTAHQLAQTNGVNSSPVSGLGQYAWAAPRDYDGTIYFTSGDGWTAQTNFGALREVECLDAGVPSYVWAGTERQSIYLLRYFESITRVAQGIGLTWESTIGVTYRIEWTDNPSSDNWRFADEVTASRTNTTWGDIGDPALGRPAPRLDTERFYRVRVRY